VGVDEENTKGGAGMTRIISNFRDYKVLSDIRYATIDITTGFMFWWRKEEVRVFAENDYDWSSLSGECVGYEVYRQERSYLARKKLKEGQE